MRRLQRYRAYSLYELLMTLGLISLVLTIGAPSLSGITANSRLRVEVNALFHAIHLARKDSVVRRRAVTLCPSTDGLNCDPGMDWSEGWIRFVNTDRDSPAVRDADEAVLQHHEVGPGNLIVANRMAFTLRSTELRATNGTFIFCDRRGRTTPRALVVSYTGRPRVAYRDRSGAAYRCAH